MKTTKANPLLLEWEKRGYFFQRHFLFELLTKSRQKMQFLTYIAIFK